MEATLKMQEKLKNFKLKIQKILGIKISDRETIELFKKYGSCGDDCKYALVYIWNHIYF